MPEKKQTAAAAQKKRKAEIQDHAVCPQGCLPYRDTEDTAQNKEVAGSDDDQFRHKKLR